MLKQRVITASILAPLVLGAVLMLPTHYLAIMLALVLLVAGSEWSRLAGATRLPVKLAFLLTLTLCIAGAAYLSDIRSDGVLWILAANMLWWLVVLLRLTRFTGSRLVSGVRLEQMFEGIIVLVPAWLALVLIHQVPEDGPWLLVFLLLLIWIADIAAYFSGRRWGRVKLAPQVSPGKTREGVYGALAGALLCGLLLAWWQGWGSSIYPLSVILCVATVVVSVLGDLFVSMLKRQRDVKDSGHLLPGHGGLLDRIDSLTAAAPLFLFGLILLGVSP